MIQSSRNSAHATAAEMSWHVQNWDLVGILETNLEQTEYPQEFSHEVINLCEQDPFYYNGLNLIPAWVSNYIHYNVWGEITYPFLNFNDATVEV